MELTPLLDALFPLGHAVTRDDDVLGGTATTAAGEVTVIGTANKLEVGVDHALALADCGARHHLHQLAAAQALKAEAPRQPGAQKNQADHRRHAEAGLQQARCADGGRSHVVNGRGHGGKAHARASFCMRSEGVTMSVRRMPYFSFTTTTSPCAMR